MIKTNIRNHFGFGSSMVLFGISGLILFLETKYLIPDLTKVSGVETLTWWFVVAARGMFILLLFIASCLLRNEAWLFKPAMWRERMYFRKMNTGNWLWGIWWDDCNWSTLICYYTYYGEDSRIC